MGGDLTDATGLGGQWLIGRMKARSPVSELPDHSFT